MMILDLRHLYNYEDAFTMNNQWQLEVNFSTDSGSNYSMYLGSEMPQPDGFVINDELPQMFSIMVAEYIYY